jgi:hypothetical protein
MAIRTPALAPASAEMCAEHGESTIYRAPRENACGVGREPVEVLGRVVVRMKPTRSRPRNSPFDQAGEDRMRMPKCERAPSRREQVERCPLGEAAGHSSRRKRERKKKAIAPALPTPPGRRGGRVRPHGGLALRPPPWPPPHQGKVGDGRRAASRARRAPRDGVNRSRSPRRTPGNRRVRKRVLRRSRSAVRGGTIAEHESAREIEGHTPVARRQQATAPSRRAGAGFSRTGRVRGARGRGRNKSERVRPELLRVADVERRECEKDGRDSSGGASARLATSAPTAPTVPTAPDDRRELARPVRRAEEL